MAKELPIEDDVSPELPAEETLRNEIMKQSDAVQTLVRPLHNNIDSLFSEEIIESLSMRKKVKTTFIYKEVELNGKKVRVGGGSFIEEI